jgi:hypothetical protein
MIAATQRKRSRLAAFKRVLVEAAKPPPPSPAFAVYRAATNDGERRAAYHLLTQTDHEAIIADAHKSIDVQMKTLANERRADAVTFKVRLDGQEKAIKLADDSRIAALPPPARRRVQWSRLMVKIICVTGTCLFVAFVAAQLIGEVGYFVWSLFHDWIFWVFLIGANIAIFSICIVAAYWRVIIAVMRAIPSAICAAITGGQE